MNMTDPTTSTTPPGDVIDPTPAPVTPQPDPAATATGTATGPADRARTMTATGLDKLSKTMQRVAGEDEEPTAVSDIATALGQGTERAATYLRTTDTSGIVADAKAFAKRQPALVAGGALIVATLVSRMLRGSKKS
jgi:hypothetical protein